MSASSVGATDQVATPPVGPAPMLAEARQGRWGDVWRAIRRNRKAVAGVLLMAVFVVVSIFPGQIAPYNPRAKIFPPALGASWHHLLGTTAYGEDVFSQLVWGARLSLVIALAVGAVATALAVLVGVSAGYLGGATDGFLSLVTDVILVLPIFPLIIVIAAYEKNAGFLTLVVVLGVLGWSYGARQLRSQTLSLRRRDFLESARVRGERKSYVILYEILPTMTSLIVATFLGAALYAVLTAAGLQFIGLGDPNSLSWGTMLYWAANGSAVPSGHWWDFIFPGMAIALTVIALVFLQYGVDELSNPKLRNLPKVKRQRFGRVGRLYELTRRGTTRGATT
jgi:peptide/nickel transport system permease protein